MNLMSNSSGKTPEQLKLDVGDVEYAYRPQRDVGDVDDSGSIPTEKITAWIAGVQQEADAALADLDMTAAIDESPEQQIQRAARLGAVGAMQDVIDDVARRIAEYTEPPQS